MKLKHDLLHTHSQILWLRCFLVSLVFLALLSITWLFSGKMKHQRSVMLIWNCYITIWYCGIMWLPTQIFVRKASSYIRLDLALKIRTKLRTHNLDCSCFLCQKIRVHCSALMGHCLWTTQGEGAVLNKSLCKLEATLDYGSSFKTAYMINTVFLFFIRGNNTKHFVLPVERKIFL